MSCQELIRGFSMEEGNPEYIKVVIGNITFMSERFQILSLDGGGLKGIFTASFLSAIEEATGKSFLDHFDLIAGTSTGGIIALALGIGYKPSDVLGFYLEKGPMIFPRGNRFLKGYWWARKLFRARYSSQPLEKALLEYFTDSYLFQSKTRLIIPSFDPYRADVYIYKTPHHVRLKCDYKEKIHQIALATASAPTFFEACVSESGVRLIDGGIWANNPTMVALTEALGYLDKKPSEVAILSIGTTRGPISSNTSQWSGGRWAWKEKAVEFMLHGQILSADNQAFHILGRDRYMRVNPPVAENLPLDSFPKELKGLGYSEARNRVNEIEHMFFQHKPEPYRPLYEIPIPEKEVNHD